MTLRTRDLLALEPLSADELTFLLDQSKPFQEIQRHPLKKLATLRGKTVSGSVTLLRRLRREGKESETR